jgi:hypothetical protein
MTLPSLVRREKGQRARSRGYVRARKRMGMVGGSS